MTLYFRIRENGASVYRLDTDNRQRRLDMQHVAQANIRSGEIRLQKEAELSEAERAEVEAWIERRRATLAAREAEAPQRLIEDMNLIAGWITSKASDEEAEAVADDLLFAMHDLRAAIVRRKAKALG